MHHETATIEPPASADTPGDAPDTAEDALDTPEETPEEAIADLRGRIDEIDRRLTRLMAERASLALEVGRRKSEAGVPLKDPSREARVVRNAAERARSEELDEEVVRQIYWCLIDLASRAQRDDRP